MFCTKCGNEIAPGSRFCNFCGARVEMEEPVFNTAKTETSKPDVDLEEKVDTSIGAFDLFDRAEIEQPMPQDFDFEWTQELDINKRAMDMDKRVSFDWSSVIDESHKKVIPDVKSPWDDTMGLSGDELDIINNTVSSDSGDAEGISLEEKILSDAESSKPDRSRTESFIDLIKNENSHRPAYMDAGLSGLMNIEEPLDPTIDTHTTTSFTFDFGDMGREIREREETKTFTFDIPKDEPGEPTVEIQSPFVEPDIADHTPDFEEQLAYIRARRAEELAEEREAREREQKETRDFLFGDYDTETETPAEPVAEISEEPAYEALVFEVPKQKADDMDEELASILGLNSEFLDAEIKAEEPAIEHEEPDFTFAPEPEIEKEEIEVAFETVKDESDKSERDLLRNLGIDIEDAYLDYEPTKRTARFEAITDEMIAADLLDEEDDDEEDIEATSEVIDTESSETEIQGEDVDEVDSEIAALQARLAALMERKTGTLDRIMEETEPAPNEVPLEGFEPVFEEPVVEAPVVEEFVFEEPVFEEPVFEEPVFEEPVFEEPVFEEPAIEEPVAEEPKASVPEFVANQKSLEEQLAALGLSKAEAAEEEVEKTSEEIIEDLRTTETASTGVDEEAEVEISPREGQEFYTNTKSLEDQIAVLEQEMPIFEHKEEDVVYDGIEDNVKSLEAQLAALGFYVPDRSDEAAPVVEPVAEPVIEATSVVEPVVEPVAEPVIEAAPVVEPVAEPVIKAAPVVEPEVEPAPAMSDEELDAILGKRDAITLDFSEEPVSIPEEWQAKYATHTINAVPDAPSIAPVIATGAAIEGAAAVAAPEIDIPAVSAEASEVAPEIDVPVVGASIPDGAVANLEGIDIPEVVPEPGQQVMSIDEELAALGFDIIGEPAATEQQGEMMFTADSTTTEAGIAAAESAEEAERVMSIEELEKDLFGASVQTEDEEVTRKMEKFHTLYKKNEEFQQLLDDEYEKLQGGSDYTKMMDVVDQYDKNEEKDYSTQVLGPITTQQIRENIEQERAEAKTEGLTEVQVEKPDPSKVIAPVQEPASVAEEAAKAENKNKNKAALAKPEKDRGGILTVIAIIVAILLAFLLVIILVLNFWPESALAIHINDWIGKVTGLGAVPIDEFWLL